jgi:TolA-binding protein
MKKILRYLCTSVLLMTGSLYPVCAQKTAIYDMPDAEFRDAQELFNKEKFGAAEQKFLNVVKATKGQISELSAQSEYYAAMCALELFNSDAEYLVVQYIRNHPEHTRVYNAWYQLARFQFRNKKYTEAMSTFEKVDQYKLNDDEKNEYNFKNGYCAFMLGDYEKAKKSFFEVKDKESKYAAGAIYYFAHIAYSEKNYETALKSFKRITNDEVYGRFAPYYITQIYYMQGKYDELLQVAPALLDSATSKRAPEIAHMIGDAYYKTQRYGDAIPYMEMYMDKNAGNATRDDFYVMGYSYYQTNDPDNAIIWFRKVNTDPADSLSQATLYQIGDCNLQNGEKIAALNYFNMAYKLGIDPVISENALFNYSKLAYETSYNPYNEAINSFQKYINEYPASTHLDEAYEYLSNLYISTRNYKDALQSLENIKKRDAKLNSAYQKVSYFRGVELFTNSAFNDAILHFNKSLKVPMDQGITAQATYWRGEAYYRQEAWDSALVNYQKFLRSPGAFGLPEFNLANYNAGYCWFKKKDYASALTAFRKFLGGVKNENENIVNDANLRAGDCFFMTKDYNSAIDFYDKSIAMKLNDNDYALYQKALAYGPLGKFENKAAVLAELAQKFPNSNYADDALYEAADTWQNLGKNDKAVELYNNLMRDYPDCAFISKAMLGLGLIYWNEGKDDLAMNTLKEVVTKYRGTPEARSALEPLKNIYVEANRVNEFFDLLKDQGQSVENLVQDSLTFFAAQNLYMKGQCDDAVRGFTNYINSFPEGQFAIDANFYRSECQYSAGNFDDALKGYEYVTLKPVTLYLESSLLKAAGINFEKKNYKAALDYYTRLSQTAEYKENVITAQTGIMRCNSLLLQYNEAIAGARQLLLTEKLSAELQTEAHITIARSALAIDSVSVAVAEFSTVSKMTKSELGAEAKWNLAYIQYILGNYEESEKAAFDLINQVPSYDYWIAKSFILLADDYVKLGNNRQAKYTLQSIIDNYEGADLVKQAQDKMNVILENEKQEELKKQQMQQQPDGSDKPNGDDHQDVTDPNKF